MVWIRIRKISPKNVKFFHFFPSGQKNCFGSGRKVPGSNPGRPLIYCRSKVSSGRVGSGQGPSLINSNRIFFIWIRSGETLMSGGLFTMEVCWCYCHSCWNSIEHGKTVSLGSLVLPNNQTTQFRWKRTWKLSFINLGKLLFNIFGSKGFKLKA